MLGLIFQLSGFCLTHRLQSSSFLPYRILNINHRMELLWSLLGGSWVGISRVISRVSIVITYIKGLITPLRTIP